MRSRKWTRRCALAVFFLLLSGVPVSAEKPKISFKDPQDGAFDLSSWVASKTGFLPILSPITEPAVGYGGTLAVLFFGGGGLADMLHPKVGPSGRAVPPDVSAFGGALTENGTWAAFAGYMGFWKDDRWRYLGAVAKMVPTLDYYGRGDRAFRFDMDSWGVFQELTRRIGSSEAFLGARFVYCDSHVQFEHDTWPVDIPQRGFDSRIGALGVVGRYDSRDNIFTPNRGIQLEANASFFEEWLGSDRPYQDYQAIGKFYQTVSKRFVLAEHFKLESVGGRPPFYAEPFINLRGVPMWRYQDRAALSVEAEVRWNCYHRWWAVLFGGSGWTAEDTSSLLDGRNVNAGGVGFRYLIIRALGIQMGMDFAKSSEDSAMYVVFGSSF